MIDSSSYLVPVSLDFKEIEGQKFLGSAKERIISNPEQTEQPAVSEPKPKPQSVLPTEPKPQVQHYWTIDQQHDVRTALNGIMGFGSIMLKEETIANEKRIKGFVEGILKNSKRLKSILDKQGSEIQDDVGQMNLTTVDLATVLQKVKIILEPQALELSVPLIIERVGNYKLVTDEARLYKVLHFIVEKALLYTRNPQVTIEVVEENSPERLSIKVDNIGMDIPQQVINFIRREQTRPLYETSNPILDAYPDIRTLLRNLNVLEGKIQFQTSPQLGEIAIISFSKQSVGHPDETEARVEAEIKHKSLKILIVEDDKINALILGLYLGDLVNVTTAFSGNEALNIIEMQYNQGVVYNLVLMDIGLPEPWNGVLLKTEIEKKWPEYRNVPFIAQTAHTHDSWAERIMNENFKGYLVKPLNRLDVLLHVNKFGL
jgi:CheY-like chemotaxis protein